MTVSARYKTTITTHTGAADGSITNGVSGVQHRSVRRPSSS